MRNELELAASQVKLWAVSLENQRRDSPQPTKVLPGIQWFLFDCCLISSLHAIFQHILVSLWQFTSSPDIKSNSCYHLLTLWKVRWTFCFPLYSGFPQKSVTFSLVENIVLWFQLLRNILVFFHAGGTPCTCWKTFPQLRESRAEQREYEKLCFYLCHLTYLWEMKILHKYFPPNSMPNMKVLTPGKMINVSA